MNDRLEEYIDSLDRRISSLQAQRESARLDLAREIGAQRSYDEVGKVWRGSRELAALVARRQTLIDELNTYANEEE